MTTRARYPITDNANKHIHISSHRHTLTHFLSLFLWQKGEQGPVRKYLLKYEKKINLSVTDIDLFPLKVWKNVFL